MTINNKKKSLIHVAKARCGMSELEYRDMLLSFGVESSADLTEQKFDAVMKHFEKLGFKKYPPRKKSPYTPFGKGGRRDSKSSKQLLLSKIDAICKDLNLTEAYVNGMSAKMFKNDDGEPIASYKWLHADQLRRIVAALMYHKKRVQGVKDSRVQANDRGE